VSLEPLPGRRKVQFRLEVADVLVGHQAKLETLVFTCKGGKRCDGREVVTKSRRRITLKAAQRIGVGKRKPGRLYRLKVATPTLSNPATGETIHGVKRAASVRTR
jgi:hypothetical protein